MKDYIDESFHGHVIRRIKEQCGGKPWSSLDEGEKVALLSLMWMALLDRLEYANDDVQPVWRAIGALIQSVDGQIYELQLRQSDAAGEINRLNRFNARQLEQMAENDKKSYAELADLSQGMLDRFMKIEQALMEAGADLVEFEDKVRSLFDAANHIADRFDYLALRHFYSTFKAGGYKCITALCLGSRLLRTAAGCLPRKFDHGEAVFVFQWNPDLEREYDLELLCSFGSGFDFLKFDDETDTLLPEVVELLYPDA
ncbi:hypothetical protein [Paenibacillus thalictri]|uniref:Uncharacterized protein n=1 Tax=Paenibacillus thalictri TaxID=2527873 RepID=A0A4Q9DZX3_9BACL|nr:hypothetical protein [Paenibacillus thalictri]TBL80841.1 hypothetical protein EYB31_06385 [Paenibacillus thalictri]